MDGEPRTQSRTKEEGAREHLLGELHLLGPGRKNTGSDLDWNPFPHSARGAHIHSEHKELRAEGLPDLANKIHDAQLHVNF